MERATSRRDNTPIKVYCTNDEKHEITLQAKAAGLSVSSYLLNVGLGYQISGILDQQRVSDMAKINADLGRLGGLLKMWLTNDERLAHFNKHQIEETILALLEKIGSNQDHLRETMRDVISR